LLQLIIIISYKLNFKNYHEDIFAYNWLYHYNYVTKAVHFLIF